MSVDVGGLERRAYHADAARAASIAVPIPSISPQVGFPAVSIRLHLHSREEIMNEKDCVSLYVDIFKWGMVILTVTIGWGLSNHDFLDWPGDGSAKGYLVRVFFIIFTGMFWIGWATVLDNVRHRSTAAPSQDFLRAIGLSWINWLFCLIGLMGYWYIVFDDLMANVAALAVLAALLAVPVARWRLVLLEPRGTPATDPAPTLPSAA
jgi:hypothetical protein